MPEYSAEFLAELKKTRDLAAKRNTPEGKLAAQEELKGLNLYQVAASSGEDRDPSTMGEIEGLLHRGDFKGLEARLGPAAGKQVRDLYLQTWQQAVSDRDTPRSVGETIQDVVVGVPANVLKTGLGAEALALGLVSDTLGTEMVKGINNFDQNAIQPLMSDAYKARTQFVSAKTALDERVHEEEAQATADAARGEFLPSLGAWTGRVAKDAVSAAANTASDPVLLMQGVADAAASMGTAAVLKEGLEATGKALLKDQLENLTTREALAEGAEGILGKLGNQVMRQLDRNAKKGVRESVEESLEQLSWAGSNALLEGSGAYQQTVTQALQQGATAEQANDAGLMAAGLTGVTAAGLSHLIGAPGKEPTKVVTGSLTKDVLEEGLEEGLQGFTGALNANAAMQAFVNPNQDILDGVGAQTGEGALLGALSAGGMKAPGTVLNAPRAAGAVLGKIADARQEKQAEGFENSVQSLAKKAEALFKDTDKEAKFTQAVGTALANDEKALDAAIPEVIALSNSLLLGQSNFPAEHANLSPAHQQEFKPGQNRVEAVNEAAKLLLQEKDPAQQTELALFLTALLEPVRHFRETPEAFQALTENAPVMDQIKEYQQILTGVEQLPSVQKALTKMSEVLKPKGEVTVESLATPEGQKAAQVLAAQAVLNPGLDGKVSAGSVKAVLDHFTGGLTSTQRRALQGSLALLQAREDVEQQRLPEATRALMERHLKGDRTEESTSRQAMVETTLEMMENGKYSARHHTDRIINAMMSGNLGLARILLEDFGKFARHYQNKVVALNESFQQAGAEVAYSQLRPDTREFESSKSNPDSKYKGVFVQKKSPNSIAIAQRMDAEAHVIQQLHASMAQAFSELGVQALQPQRLVNVLRNTNTKAMAKQKAEREAKEAQKTEPVKSPAEKVTEAVDRALAPKEETTKAPPAPAPTNQVRERNTVKPTPKPSPAFAETLHTKETDIQGREEEHGAFIDQTTGKVLWEGKGEKDHVNTPKWAEKAIRERGTVVFTHNHPSGSAILSPGDVALAMELNLAEMRVVTPNGQVARLVRPKGGWSTQSVEKVKTDLNGVRKSLQERFKKIPETPSRLQDYIVEGIQAFNAYSEATGQGWQMVLEGAPKVTTSPAAVIEEHFNSLDEEGQSRALLTDPMTGLYSQAGARLLPVDPKRSFLVVFSLEGKKFLNDFHGHKALDGALRVMAKVVSKHTPQGMKIDGDIQGFFPSLEEAQKVAAQMQKAIGSGFQVAVNGAQYTGYFDSTLSAANDALNAANQTARESGKFAARKSPPVALYDAAMPKGINWDYDAKEGNTTGVDPGSPEVQAWLKAIAQRTTKFGERLTETKSETLLKTLDPKALEKVNKLSRTEKRDAIYYEPGTGMLTQAGYEVASSGKASFVSMDLRSLKLMNKLFGKAEADHILKLFGKLLVRHGGDKAAAAHLHGDEYAMAGMDPAQLELLVAEFENLLNDVVLYKTELNEDGSLKSLVVQEGLSFAWGIGKTLEEADREDLARRKEADKQAGKRIFEPVRLTGSEAEQQLAKLQANKGAVDLGLVAERRAASREAGNGVPEAAGPSGVRPEQTVAPKTVVELFPRLHQVVGKVRNFFHQAFQPKENSSRLLGKTSSVQLVVDATSGEVAFKAFTGKDPRAALTPEVIQAYRELLTKTALEVAGALNGQLEAFLKKPWKGITREKALREGRMEMTLLEEGKVLNLVELGEDNVFRYNSELLQQAILAALQWQIVAGQRQAPLKKEEIAEELGLEEGLVPDTLLFRMGQGEALWDAKNSLASTIRRFWGVTGDTAQPMGFTEAIPEAMAAELLRAMETTGLVTVDRIAMHEEYPDLVGRDQKVLNTPLETLRKDSEPFQKKVWWLMKEGLSQQQAELQARDWMAMEKQTFERFIAKNWNQEGKDSPLYLAPSLIEETVSVEPELRSFYGEETVPVLDRQLSNPQMRTSRKSKQARQNMQAQRFLLNMPMVEAVFSLGEEKLIELFGTVLPKDEATRNKLYNKKHLESLEAQNLGLLGAFATFKHIHQEMLGAAKDGDVSKVAKKYQYAVNSVNRVMMLGAHNPQANKLMRELLMPTWSNLDLSEGLQSPHYRYLMQAVAQALGEKVHNHAFERNVQWAHEAINGPLAPAIDVLAKWLGDKSQPYPVAELKAALGSTEASPLVVMALTEMARMKRATPEQLKAFRTPLYLESDGMTNGPFNSMGLLAVGHVTADDVLNWRRGGLNVGKRTMTADQLRKQAGDKDIYKAGVDATADFVARRLEGIRQHRGGEGVSILANHLFTAMSILMPKDVWLEEDKTWKFDRGLGKSPTTKKVYGSGTAGIASGIAHDLQTAFYEKLSTAARVLGQGGTIEDAAAQMFPKLSREGALEQWNQLRDAMETITWNQVAYNPNRGSAWLLTEKKRPASPLARMEQEGIQEFSLTPEEFKRLQANLKNLLVDPMDLGIRSVLGASVFRTGDLLVKATQIQSTMARELYLKEILKKVEEKTKSRTEKYLQAGLSQKEAEAKARLETRSEFLSRQELDAVWESLVNVMPLVESDGQSFLIAKSNLLAFWDEARKDKRSLFQYSRSLDDGMRTSPYVKGVDAAGVAAIPYMTIGMGDARMVRKIFEQAFEGSLQVFDGINIPVDKIPEYGRRINQAALEAWQGTVLQDVTTTFERFAQDPRVKALLNDEGMFRSLQEELNQNIDLEGVLQDLKLNTRMANARRVALSKFAISMDQMAGTYQPYVTEGRDVPENATEQDIANLINIEYEKALAGVEEKAPEESGKRKLAFSVFDKKGRRHASGAWVLSKTALLELPKMLKEYLTPNENELLGEILRSGSLGNTKVVAGTHEQLVRYMGDNDPSSLEYLQERSQEGTLHGFYDHNSDTVYVINPQVETLLHELVHAATSKAVHAYYQGKVTGPAAEAIQRLEALLKTFLETDFEAPAGSKLEQSLTGAKNTIQRYIGFFPSTLTDARTEPEAKAGAVNEFMAWTLTNLPLAEELSKRTAPETQGNRLVRLVKAAYQAIKKLVWGRKQAPSHGEDVLSQIRFNTAIVARQAPSLEVVVRDIAHAHTILNGTEGVSTRAAELLEVFGRRVARHLNQNYSTGLLEKLSASKLLAREMDVSIQMKDLAIQVFGLSPENATAFQMMVLAFATENVIDPAAMTEAQKAFDHFLRGLAPKDFLTGKGDEQNDLAQATDKFEFISGHTRRLQDSQGRSTLLPVFLALAQVDEGFRALLAKKDLPRSQKQKVTGMDSLLERLGSALLAKLEGRLTGTSQPDTVKAAIDQLTQHVIKTTQETAGALEERLSQVEGGLRGLNGKMAAMLQKLGTKSEQWGQTLKESESKFNQKLSLLPRALALLASEENEAVIREDILSWVDKHPDVWASFKELITDLLGRTKSQAEVYDMLKKIRTEVSRSRQDYKDKVPAVIMSKFKQQPNQDQWNALYQMMGRYDLASLLEGRDVKQVLDLAASPEALAQEVSRLEAELKEMSSEQAIRYNAKIDQYVAFVRTGVYGRNLLRNAQAIAHLLSEPRNQKTWVEPSERTVQTIDQLITLKLLARAEENDRTRYSNLLQSERTGLEFVLNYLKGQRATEMRKGSEGPAKFNHFKGLLPYEQQGRGHVIVADDDQQERLTDLGYQRLGAYKGSTLEQGGGSRSYYFSPEGGAKTAFQQGIAQNVQQTAYGVHMETGFSTGLTGGVISDPVYVKSLVERMHREANGTENLSPIYDDTGKVVGFERTLDPKHLKELQQPQNLAKMIGQWKGRQVEEVEAAKVNEALVDALHKMWEDDLDGNPGSEERYVNLFDTKNLDPVARDAVAILPRELKAYARSKFGPKKFLVRRNMLNMTIGYRSASVGDFWTGTSRYSKETQELVKKSLQAILGNDAYRMLVSAERNWQAVMAGVRTNIVVRSIVVPAANFVSGIYQLAARGVPLHLALKKVPAKVAEIEYYTKAATRKIELEAEKFANENNIQIVRRIDAQLLALEDSLKRLSIWPLIEAGEFSTISDVGQTAEDLGVGPNNIVERMTQAVDNLPPGFRDLARQSYMARDTALFQALQKSVQYSDFVMKAIYFDHLTQVEKRSAAAARGVITEEFNNYDLPTGRTRGYVESMGLAWFLNYKIRATKVALSMIRNNPLNLLLYTVIPHPFASGLPVTDNLFASIFRRTLGYGLGPNMMVKPIALNPWYSLIAD